MFNLEPTRSSDFQQITTCHEKSTSALEKDTVRVKQFLLHKAVENNFNYSILSDSCVPTFNPFAESSHNKPLTIHCEKFSLCKSFPSCAVVFIVSHRLIT